MLFCKKYKLYGCEYHRITSVVYKSSKKHLFLPFMSFLLLDHNAQRSKQFINFTMQNFKSANFVSLNLYQNLFEL